jgi:hypothetical protein
MRRFAQLSFFSFTLASIFVACGSRTGLLVGDVAPYDASLDQSIDTSLESEADAPILREGGPRDVVTDCPDPPYCDPNDPDHVYKCGTITYDCSSLEQCETVGESGAKCVNPCVDTLGQDTSNGCDFYAVQMDATPDSTGVCYAVFIVNQWKTGEPARLEVSLGATPYSSAELAAFARIPQGKGTGITYAPFDPRAGLAKDQIAILFLSRDPDGLNDPNPTDPRRLASCPAGVTPAVVGDAALHGTGIGKAFRIKSNVPVVAYQILPYGGGSARITGATLLLPTNVWGDNYVVANAYQAPTMFMEDRAGPTTVIIGKEDGTNVTIKPTTPILPGGGLHGSATNVSTTYTVNAGQYLQFTQPIELTGTAIQADRPVAVIGGSTLVDIPTTKLRADGAHQMLPPVGALGSVYLGVRYRNRRNRGEESVPWRLVGVVDGTQLTFDPPQPGGPTAIDARQLLEFNATGPFVVRSQDANHPFYFAQYMTGGQAFSTGPNTVPDDGEGDPEFVNVITPPQYLSRYTFFTDPTYPETNLVVTRVRDTSAGQMPDVTLDCIGLLSGWQPVGTDGRFEFTRVDLQTGNFQAVGACDNGVHVLTSTLPGDGGNSTPFVGLTVWGWGNPLTYPPTDNEANPLFTRWVSYGYPAGANITKLSSVVLPAN